MSKGGPLPERNGEDVESASKEGHAVEVEGKSLPSDDGRVQGDLWSEVSDVNQGYSSCSDCPLVARAREAKALFGRHAENLFKFVKRRIPGDDAAVHDVFQNASFIVGARLVQEIENHDSAAQLDIGEVYNIFRGQVRRYWRGVARERERNVSLSAHDDDSGSPAFDVPSPVNVAEEVEAREELYGRFSRLSPARQLALLVLPELSAYFNSLRVSDRLQMLGVSSASHAKRLHDAKEALKKA